MPAALREPSPADPAPASSPVSAADETIVPIAGGVYELSAEAARDESRNFLVIALYQIIVRTGWIFKTESIVMPAVLDVITGGGMIGGMMRGLLPVLNRLGQSVPPLLVARRLKIMPRKKLSVLRSTLAMAAALFALAIAWRLAGPVWWMSLAFLAGYTVFFAATGINNLSLGTLQGKLIHATRRGRLLTFANACGAVTAIAAAATLMPLWLSKDSAQFDLIFGFTGLSFALAAVCVLLVREPPDAFHEPSRGMRHVFASSWRIIREDANFRRLGLVAMAFSSSLVLFPHYQALARERLHLNLESLVTWVVVQNAGTGLFSVLTGPLADRRGNRLVMQLVMFALAAMPVAAIGLSYAGVWGAWLYPAIFFFIGITPVGLKTLNNYTLEISRAEDHPRYLSTVGLCMAAPLVLSPVLGFLAEATSFEVVFLSVSVLLLAGGIASLRLHEPRTALMNVG
jgi:hypothetical protein